MAKTFGHLSPHSSSGFSQSKTEVAYENYKALHEKQWHYGKYKKTANVFQLVDQKSGEERSTCYTVTVPLHRSTISLPQIIQIFSKTSRSKACFIDIFIAISRFRNIIDQQLLFDHKHSCI